MYDFNCRVVLDSISPAGARITTMELTYPRFIHSEVLTHRDRARNSASSRAIPYPKMRAAILETPVIPIKWGAEQRGMQTGDEISGSCTICDGGGAKTEYTEGEDIICEGCGGDGQRLTQADRIWLKARDNAVASADALHALGVHKSLCNRLTEPFMWITVIMTATQWRNFFKLRVHKDAEIHFQKIAGMAKDAMDASRPVKRVLHLPYVDGSPDLAELMKLPVIQLKRISAGRCARVSYLTHDGKIDIEKDLELCERLAGADPLHASPLEHPATAADDPTTPSGPFRGWHQFRKEFENECADSVTDQVKITYNDPE